MVGFSQLDFFFKKKNTNLSNVGLFSDYDYSAAESQ